MPVKKIKKAASKSRAPKEAPAHHAHMLQGAKKILWTIIGILLVYLTVFIGTEIRNNIEEFEHIGFADKTERTIAVSANAKVPAAPDTAKTTIGMIAAAPTVEEAQTSNTAVMNKLLKQLVGLGVSADDVQTTSYNIYPQYNFTELEGRVLEGYEVSQSVTVKIRDLDRANEVLALAGQVGANSVSGLEFVIDDREVYKAKARELALKKVASKMGSLSRMLNVQIEGIVSYDEFEMSNTNNQVFAEARTLGLGGTQGPEISPGNMDVELNVNVIFEIR